MHQIFKLNSALKLGALSMAAAIFLTGCAESVVNVLPEVKGGNQQAHPEQKGMVSLSVSDMSVRKLMKSVCEANALSCDFSAQPAEKYAVTFNYNGNLDGLFSAIKRQTGIVYQVVDGMIILANKDDITVYQDPLRQSGENKTLTISFKNIKLADAFKYFYDEFGYSFVFDTHYTPIVLNISPAQAQAQIPILASVGPKNEELRKAKNESVSFYYTGSDPKEALASFMTNIDMTMTEVKEKEFKIKDYDVVMYDKSVYFDYSMSSGSGGQRGSSASSGANGNASSSEASSSGGGSASSGATASGGSASTSTTTVSLSEKYKQGMETMLKNHLSENGKLDMSMRGYIIIEDKPSSIRAIKKIIDKEIEKEAPLSISVNIVRIDLKDDFKAGVDWNAVWAKGLGLNDLSISSSMSQFVGGGFTFKGKFKGTEQVLTMLQEYGNTKIERSRTINARSGFLANFEATKPIPYIITTSTITGGTTGFAQGAVSPLFEEEGVVLNMLPNINLETKTVDLGVDVSVAEYIGDKTFDLGSQGTYTLPIVTKDKGKFAVQAKFGETIVLTGFKVKKGATGKKGIPLLSQIPVVGVLFGYQEGEDDSSEILIILKVDQVTI